MRIREIWPLKLVWKETLMHLGKILLVPTKRSNAGHTPENLIIYTELQNRNLFDMYYFFEYELIV